MAGVSVAGAHSGPGFRGGDIGLHYQCSHSRVCAAVEFITSQCPELLDYSFKKVFMALTKLRIFYKEPRKPPRGKPESALF